MEAKEGVTVEPENITYATITLQNYFRMYEKLAGMTGTALTEAEEFYQDLQTGSAPAFPPTWIIWLQGNLILSLWIKKTNRGISIRIIL